MQSASIRIWTRVAVSISYDDNHYTTDTSTRGFLPHSTPRSCMSCGQCILSLDRTCEWIRTKIRNFLFLIVLPTCKAAAFVIISTWSLTKIKQATELLCFTFMNFWHASQQFFCGPKIRGSFFFHVFFSLFFVCFVFDFYVFPPKMFLCFVTREGNLYVYCILSSFQNGKRWKQRSDALFGERVII